MKLVDQLLAATKHFCQTSGLRDTERFCLLFLLDFQSRSVTLSPVVFAIDWFCVCTADHTSVIFTIVIEIYRVVVFLL